MTAVARQPPAARCSVQVSAKRRTRGPQAVASVAASTWLTVAVSPAVDCRSCSGRLERVAAKPARQVAKPPNPARTAGESSRQARANARSSSAR